MRGTLHIWVLAWDPALHIVVEPPAICETECQCQKRCLCRQLIGNQQPAVAQQRLAILDGDLHVARGMQHVGGEKDVIPPNAISL